MVSTRTICRPQLSMGLSLPYQTGKFYYLYSSITLCTLWQISFITYSRLLPFRNAKRPTPPL